MDNVNTNQAIEPTYRPTGSTHRTIEPSILYFGTPIALIGTVNPDGSANLAPMSSVWALGYTLVLGLGASGQTAANLRRQRECTVNFPDPSLWQAVERLAPLTGRNPVPESKQGSFRFEADKFGAAELTAQPPDVVAPPRVKECKFQCEGRVRHMRTLQTGALCVEVEVLRVHASEEIVVEGTSYIDPQIWQPLLYVFRHYVAGGDNLGKTFRAEF